MSNLELKGLRNLLELDDLLAESKTEEFLKENIFYLPIHLLVSGKHQPRSMIDDESLKELAISIKSQGILLPLIVRRLTNQKFEIIAGERRWRAAALAELKTVPVIIKDIPDQTAFAFALIENIQRESLNPIDEAIAFERLISGFCLTHEEIANRVGRSRSAVTNLVRLLGLNKEVKELLLTRKIEMGHGRALLSLCDNKQVEIAKQVVSRSLSVRETEKIIHHINNQKEQPTVSINPALEKKALAWQDSLSKQLSTKVNVYFSSGEKGRVVINFDSAEKANWLIDHLKLES